MGALKSNRAGTRKENDLKRKEGKKGSVRSVPQRRARASPACQKEAKKPKSPKVHNPTRSISQNGHFTRKEPWAAMVARVASAL